MVRVLDRLMSITLFMVLYLFPHAWLFDSYCEWSKISMKKVSNCPMNEYDFKRASKIKNCESMAEKQSCTEKTNFKYHCVIDDLEENMVEVCAPVSFINGYCTEFNISGARIQDHLRFRNGSVAKPFTNRYISTDAYNYPECYLLVPDLHPVTYLGLIFQKLFLTTKPSERRIHREKLPEVEEYLNGFTCITCGTFTFIVILAVSILFFKLHKNSQHTERDPSYYTLEYGLVKNPMFYKSSEIDEEGYILNEFKVAIETNEWKKFNSLYFCLLLAKDKSITFLREFVQNNISDFVKNNIEQNVRKVYFGFCLNRKKTFIVVVIDNVFFEEKVKTYNGLPILYKQWTESTEESLNTRKYEFNEDSLELKVEEHIKIHECLVQNSTTLMKSHSNIEIISASPYRSLNKGKMFCKENCIVIYCTMKNVIPLGEMLFEKSLGEFKTDVREGFFYPYPRIDKGNLDTFVAPTEHHAELKIGGEISREDGNVKGTLGGFVEIGDKGEIGFITCAHVLHDIPERMIKNNAKVVQPRYGLFERNDVCGILIKSVHPMGFDETTVDASLVQVDSSRKPSSISFTGLGKDQIRQMGFSPNEIYSGEILEKALLNAPCYKSGAKTNFTVGKLIDGFTSAKYLKDFRNPNQEIVFHNQYVVSSTSFSPFADSGDSGAFVFQCLENTGEKSLLCIGMIVGGTSDFKVVVTPIRAVLNALDLQDTKKLCTFEDEQMETDETDEKSTCNLF